MIIDAHMHADTRPIEDYQTMKMAGVDAVVACAHDPLEMKKSNVSFEHFNRIVNYEPERIGKHDVKLFACIGVHPRAIPEDYDNVLKKLDDYLSKNHVIGIGEIGLETKQKLEQEVFIKQLQYADENGYNVIVHTPRTHKQEVCETTTKLLDEYINPKQVQLDHVDFSIIDDVIDKNYTLGITVQPQKMSVEDTVKMLDKYGFDKFVLDSDLSFAPSNPLSLPLVKHELELNGYKKEDIAKVTYKNLINFHNLKI